MNRKIYTFESFLNECGKGGKSTAQHGIAEDEKDEKCEECGKKECKCGEDDEEEDEKDAKKYNL